MSLGVITYIDPDEFHEGVPSDKAIVLIYTPEIVRGAALVNLNAKAITWANLAALINAGGGSGVYDGASPSTLQVGGMPPNTELSGRTFTSILQEILVSYLQPAFTSFGISGQAGTIEVGTTLSGDKAFQWSTSNSGNVEPNSITIRDQTASVDLATGLANDGSETIDIGSIAFNTPTSRVWRIIGTNTDTPPANFLTDFTVLSRYLLFYGPAASIPNNSAGVRALPNNRFTNAGNVFNLNTGNSLIRFVIALPPGVTITQVIDLDALNANITSEYVSQGTVSVLDAGGNSVNYTVYAMTQAIPYSSNHRHQVTISV